MNPQEILTLINTGGLVAALIYGMWLGLTGRVIPAAILKEIIAAVVAEVLEQLQDRQ